MIENDFTMTRQASTLMRTGPEGSKTPIGTWKRNYGGWRLEQPKLKRPQ